MPETRRQERENPMTDTPAHTPLPWVIDPTYPSEVQTSQLESITSCWHEQAVGQEITVTGVLPCSLTESAANAAFIVRACNSHYQLVEVLRGLLDEIIKSPCVDSVLDSAAAGHAFAALSQAGGASE